MRRFVWLLLLIGCGGGPKSTVTVPLQADATMSHGREVFAANCNRCHAYPAPDAIDPAAWPSTLDRMAERAHLSPADRDAVRDYFSSLQHH